MDFVHVVSVLGIVALFAAWVAIYVALQERKRCGRIERDMQELEAAHAYATAQQAVLAERLAQERVAQSRRVLKGKLSEELFPLLAQCPYALSDMKFFGNPIDYVVFDGLTAAKDSGEDFVGIVFLDVKTGNARLTPHQRKIKAAVTAKQVRWETVRIHDDGTIHFERDEE